MTAHFISTQAAPTCHVEVGGSYRLRRCGRYVARGLVVCLKHIDQHGRWLRYFVDEWYRALGWRRNERRPWWRRPRIVSTEVAVASDLDKGTPSGVVTAKPPRPTESSSKMRLGTLDDIT